MPKLFYDVVDWEQAGGRVLQLELAGRMLHASFMNRDKGCISVLCS